LVHKEIIHSSEVEAGLVLSNITAADGGVLGVIIGTVLGECVVLLSEVCIS